MGMMAQEEHKEGSEVLERVRGTRIQSTNRGMALKIPRGLSFCF